jgi:hypothetical protein
VDRCKLDVINLFLLVRQRFYQKILDQMEGPSRGFKPFIFNRTFNTSVVPDLPPSLSKLRGELLRRRSEMSVAEKKKTRLVYLTRPPFLRLITKK